MQLEAELLLAFVLNCPREQVLTHSGSLSIEQKQKLENLLDRRKSGEPFAYIVGEKEFFGRSYKVNPSVLIPRWETELLVEEGIKLISKDTRVLEIGTGSGCVAISLFKEKPGIDLLAIEKSKAAYETARENFLYHGTPLSCLSHTSFEEFVKRNADKFDVIIANPPYVAENSPDLQQAVHQFEPKDALIGGKNGNELISSWLNLAKAILNPKGKLLFEIGYDQGSCLRREMEDLGFCSVEVLRDMAHNERVITGEFNG